MKKHETALNLPPASVLLFQRPKRRPTRNTASRSYGKSLQIPREDNTKEYSDISVSDLKKYHAVPTYSFCEPGSFLVFPATSFRYEIGVTALLFYLKLL